MRAALTHPASKLSKASVRLDAFICYVLVVKSVRVHFEPNMLWTNFYEESMDITLLKISEKTMDNNK